MRSLRFIWLCLIFVIMCNFVIAAEKKEFAAKTDPDGVQRVEMTGGSYFFDPNYIIVKVNVPVEIKIRKESGLVPHNIILKALDAGIDIDMEMKDTPQTIRFTPLKTGIYSFACEKKLLFFESHKDKGMVGTLEVRDK